MSGATDRNFSASTCFTKQTSNRSNSTRTASSTSPVWLLAFINTWTRRTMSASSRMSEDSDKPASSCGTTKNRSKTYLHPTLTAPSAKASMDFATSSRFSVGVVSVTASVRNQSCTGEISIKCLRDKLVARRIKRRTRIFKCESRSVTMAGVITIGARRNCITLHAMMRPSYELTALAESLGPRIPPGPSPTTGGRPPPVSAATLVSQFRTRDSIRLTLRGMPILAFITIEQYWIQR